MTVAIRPRRIGASTLLERAPAGAAGGLTAAIVIAILFFVEGAIHLHPLGVPVALASGMLGGGSSSAGASGQVDSVVILAIQVLAYTVLHLLTFAAVGALAAFVVDASAVWTSVLGGIAYASVAYTGLLYAARWIVDAPVALDVLGLPRVLAANAVAGAIIGIALYLAEHGDVRRLAT
jgi:hypothetical protein